MTFQKTVTLAAVGIVAAGLLFGQARQTDSSGNGQDWEMFAQNVAAGGSGGNFGERVRGEVFLYNKRTGKVYLRFDNCTSNGRELDGGCFGSIAVFGDDELVSVTPTPTNREGNGRPY